MDVQVVEVTELQSCILWKRNKRSGIWRVFLWRYGIMKSEYIKRADVYTDRMTEVSDLIRNANYIIVTIPESSPVAQMADVKKLVMSFGGSVTGYVINNIRHESHEQEQIDRVLSWSEFMPVVQIEHDRNLCDSKPSQRRKALKEVGRIISSAFICK
jgi:hypothetical protein